MEQAGTLPPGFISVDDAVALIKSDSEEKPVVDMDYMISRLKWIEPGHNFRIPKIRQLAPEEIYTNQTGQKVYYEETGSEYVAVQTNFEKELLIKALRDKYKELVGKDYRDAITRSVSTVADDATPGRNGAVSSNAVQPRVVKDTTEVGTPITEGERVSNGDNLAV